MTYDYEIDKIFELFGVDFSSESRAKVRDFLWDILDDLADSEYRRGMDSVRCYEDCCY